MTSKVLVFGLSIGLVLGVTAAFYALNPVLGVFVGFLMLVSLFN